MQDIATLDEQHQAVKTCPWCYTTLYFEPLKEIKSTLIKEVRGRGLFIGIELNTQARTYCEQLKELGLLCKETHENTIRFALQYLLHFSNFYSLGVL